MSCEILVDAHKGMIAANLEMALSFSKFYVYSIESMATTFREYKTIRLSEFFPFADKIVNP